MPLNNKQTIEVHIPSWRVPIFQSGVGHEFRILIFNPSARNNIIENLWNLIAERIF